MPDMDLPEEELDFISEEDVDNDFVDEKYSNNGIINHILDIINKEECPPRPNPSSIKRIFMLSNGLNNENCDKKINQILSKIEQKRLLKDLKELPDNKKNEKIISLIENLKTKKLKFKKIIQIRQKLEKKELLQEEKEYYEYEESFNKEVINVVKKERLEKSWGELNRDKDPATGLVRDLDYEALLKSELEKQIKEDEKERLAPKKAPKTYKKSRDYV